MLLGILFLAGCQMQTPMAVSTSDANDTANTLTYAKDSRTNLCFAVVASQHTLEATTNGLTVTYVPCTPEVEAQIAKQ